MIPDESPTALHIAHLVRDAVRAAVSEARDRLRSRVRGMADDAAFVRGYDEGVKAATRQVGHAGGVPVAQIERTIDREAAIGGMVEVAQRAGAERQRLADMFTEGLAEARARYADEGGTVALAP